MRQRVGGIRIRCCVECFLPCHVQKQELNKWWQRTGNAESGDNKVGLWWPMAHGMLEAAAPWPLLLVLNLLAHGRHQRNPFSWIPDVVRVNWRGKSPQQGRRMWCGGSIPALHAAATEGTDASHPIWYCIFQSINTYVLYSCALIKNRSALPRFPLLLHSVPPIPRRRLQSSPRQTQLPSFLLIWSSLLGGD